MFCEHCGKPLLQGDAFCMACGAKNEGLEAETVAEPVEETSDLEQVVVEKAASPEGVHEESVVEKNVAAPARKKPLRKGVLMSAFLVLGAAVICAVYFWFPHMTSSSNQEPDVGSVTSSLSERTEETETPNPTLDPTLDPAPFEKPTEQPVELPITSYAQLSDEEKSTMEAAAETLIDARVMEYQADSSLDFFQPRNAPLGVDAPDNQYISGAIKELDSVYVLSPKKDGGVGRVTWIYATEIQYDYTERSDYDTFYPYFVVTFDGVSVQADGTMSWKTESGRVYRVIDSQFYNLYEVYEDAVGSHADEYNVEETIVSDEHDRRMSREKYSQPISIPGCGYLFYSSQRYLLPTDIEPLNAEERSMAVNEIYARHGCIFSDSKIQNYVENNLDFYHPEIEMEQFDQSLLSDMEAYNIKVLADSETSGEAESDAPDIPREILVGEFDSVQASSTLSTQENNTYDAKNVLDGDQATAWVPRGPANGIGEWIKLSTEENKEVCGIRVLNGYCKTWELFHKNSRVKSCDVYFDDGSKTSVELKDRYNVYEDILFDKAYDSSSVKIVIRDVWNGNTYTDVGISELQILVDAAIEENEGTSSLGTDAQAIFDDFISRRDYSQHIEEDAAEELQYTITDLNADGTPELLLQSPDERPFFTTWLFVLVDGEITLAAETYGYGDFRYSPRYNAVIGSPTIKPDATTGYCPFYKLEGAQFELVFSLSNDLGSHYYSDSAGKKEITEDEKLAYFGDVVNFNWEQVN